MKTIKNEFQITGMSCASCASSAESMLKSQEGVTGAAVNFAGNTALVEYTGGTVTPQDLQKAVQSIGYDLIIDNEDGAEEAEEIRLKSYQRLKEKTIWSAVLTIPVAVIGMLLMDLPYANLIMMVLTIP